MFDVIICDPHDCRSEERALGLLYTAVSRATTLGDPDGRNSALYFTGEHMNERRITRLGKKKNSQDDYKRVIDRREWVGFLTRRKKKCNLSKRRKKHILKWATTATFKWDELSGRIEKYCYDQRCSVFGSFPSKRGTSAHAGACGKRLCVSV